MSSFLERFCVPTRMRGDRKGVVVFTSMTVWL